MSVSIPLQTLFANTRAGTVYQTTSAGAIEAVSAETTCTAHWVGGKPHALFQPARTNSIRNSTFTGGTAGVLGSGGVLPTNVSIANFPAANTTVAFGTEDGFSYFEVRLNGTPTGGVLIDFDTTTGIAAATNQVWTSSFYTKLQSGSLANVSSTQIGFIQRGAAGAFITPELASVTFTSTKTRFSHTATADEATVEYVSPRVILNWVSGAIDITLRFYAPQLELGAFATTPILTSGSAVTRAADNATCSVDTFPIDQNGGSIEVIGRAYYTTGGSGFPRVFQIDDGTNDNRVSLTIVENTNTIAISVILGGASQAAETIAYTSGDEFHAVLVFEEDNVFLSLDGSNSTPDTTVSFPTGLLTTWRWAQNHNSGDNGAAVLINRIASHSHEFSTTGADAITA